MSRRPGLFGPRFCFEDRWTFALPPDRFWALVSDVASYRQWWPALLAFRSGGLGAGARSTAVIAGPLPYRLTLEFVVDAVVAPSHVEVSVAGDATGSASMLIEPSSAGSDVRLVWDVELRRTSLRLLSYVAHPVMAWAHNRVIRRAVAQFRERAL